MPKYRLKALNISIYGGNITMMMTITFIIWIQLFDIMNQKIFKMS